MTAGRRDVQVEGRSARQSTAAKRRQKALREPAPRYGVLSEVDTEGRVWHYPVALTLAAFSPAALADGQSLPSAIFFMRPATRMGAARTPVRFRSRLRAVRFTLDDAALEHELIHEIERRLAGRVNETTTATMHATVSSAGGAEGA